MDKKGTEVTREDCIAAVERHGGNKSQAAKELGIPRSTLRMKLGEIINKKAEEISV